VGALCSGLHVFSGAWQRCETRQGLAIGFVPRLLCPLGYALHLHLKKHTLHCIQLRFLGLIRITHSVFRFWFDE